MSKIIDNRWKSSFILPEHKKAILNYKQEQKRKQRPIFDEQQLEYFDYRIKEAIKTQKKVRIIVFSEIVDTELEGVIEYLDQNSRYIIMKLENDYLQIDLKDILSIGEGF